MAETTDVPTETPLLEAAVEVTETAVEEAAVDGEEKVEEKVEDVAAPSEIKTTSNILEFVGAIDTYIASQKELKEKQKEEKALAAAAEKEEDLRKRKERIERFGTEEEKAKLKRMERFGASLEELAEIAGPPAKKAKVDGKGGKPANKAQPKGEKGAAAAKPAVTLSPEEQAAKEARMKRFGTA